MHIVTLDGLGYNAITNNPRNLSDLKQLRLYLRSCYMSIKDQKSYFIYWSLLRTQTEAITDWKVKTGRVVHIGS